MELSLVVPSFRQAATICGDLRNITAMLEKISSSYELILIVDGNIDNTVQVVQQDPLLSHVRIYELQHNQGKGAALKHGLSRAQGEIIGFLDAGGDIEISCLPLMIDTMKFSDADIVIGSKRHELSRVSYPLIRRFYSTGYQILNRILFRMSIKDTQVGLKLFQRNVIQSILPHITINRFAFDLELLVVATKLGYKSIIESPIRITHTFKSTVSIKTVFEMLQDTLKIYGKMRRKKIVRLSSGVEVTRIPNKTPAREYEMG